MRVAFLAHHPSLYGASRSLVDLIQGLRDYDVNACVVAPPGGQVTQLLSTLQVPTIEMQLPWWVSSRRTTGRAVLNLGAHAKALMHLAPRLRAWKPDVIYSNSSFISVGFMASKVLGLPHVWHLREFINLDYGLEPTWGWGGFRLFTNQSDAIIAVSDAVRRHLLRGSGAERAQVIHSGVAPRAEFDRLRKAAHARKSGGVPYTFAMVGLLSPTKGQHTAIQALAHVARKVRDVRLIIAGRGNEGYLRECQGLARLLGVADAVQFLGYRNDPFPVYLESDAVLMCSQSEAQGRVTLEAMAACRPVIGNNRGGTPEIVEHEKTGLLYEGGPENLASCMLRFAEKPLWARQLGERGWDVAVEKFSTEACARQVYGVLQGQVCA